MDLRTESSNSNDDVFSDPGTDELHNADERDSPVLGIGRNSSPHASTHKKGKLSKYFCGLTTGGLKKKISKEKHRSPSPPMSESPVSNSNFYCSVNGDSEASDNPSKRSKSSDETNPSDRNGEISMANGSGGGSPSDSTTATQTNQVPIGFNNGESETAGGDEENAPQFHTLTVHLNKGKNLVIKDKTGSSDPFVKVRVGEKTLYKSKVVYADLNPVWDETFTIPIQDIKDPVIFKVSDYDWGSKDDFMGMCIISLRKLPINSPQKLTLPLSRKGLIGEKSMGEITATLTLTPLNAEEQRLYATESVTTHAQKKMQKQTWNGVLTVLLMDVHNLPKRSHPVNDSGGSESPPGYSNVYAKLSLGSQKRKSKQVMETTDRPEWIEQFDFYLYEGNGETTIFEIEIFERLSGGKTLLGSASLDISHLQKDNTMEYFLNFTNGLGTARAAFTASGFRPTSADGHEWPDRDSLVRQYSLSNTVKLKEILDVGHLTVKVIQAEGLRAADFGGKSDPFVVIELVNARVQTHTDYKTLTPTWNKSFNFQVRDITSKLEVAVYDEDRDFKTDFLGKVNIPLWNIKNGEQVWYKLRNRSLMKGARGCNPQILLQMDLIWNPIRAAVRVTEPQETKYNQPKPHLKIETFLINMERIRLVLMDAYDIWLYIKSCLDWEYPERSIKALTFYLLTCYFFQPFFIPLYLLIYWLYPWWKHGTKGPPPATKEDKVLPAVPSAGPKRASASDTLNLDESDEEEEGISNLSLLQKFNLLQDASGVLQELVGELAGICESTINTRQMVIPFIYWLFAILFAVATCTFMLIDFRYVAMLFGIHEFSRIYLRPWKQSSFELYHMIRRVPHKMNMGEKLGLNSVLKSIQQLKSAHHKSPFWKKKKNSDGAAALSPGSPTWYVQEEDQR